MSYDTIQNRGKIIPLFFPKEKDANSIFLEIQSKPRQIQKVFLILQIKKSSDFLKLYAYQLKMSHKDDDYSFSDNTLKFMIDYQNKIGANLIPEKWKIDLEILYNKVNIFHQLFKLFFCRFNQFSSCYLKYVLYQEMDSEINSYFKMDYFFRFYTSYSRFNFKMDYI